MLAFQTKMMEILREKVATHEHVNMLRFDCEENVHLLKSPTGEAFSVFNLFSCDQNFTKSDGVDMFSSNVAC